MSAPPAAPARRPVVMAVDDDQVVLASWRELLAGAGYELWLFSDPRAALQHAVANPIDVALLDLRMPGMDGLTLLQHLRAVAPDAQVIITTGHGSIEHAVEAMRRGAYDFITKPIADLGAVERLIAQALDKKRLTDLAHELERQLAVMRADHELVGGSPALARVRELIERVAQVDTTVLICGESGTGKELVAGAIHRASARRAQPFVPVNCGALGEGVLDSELFGHVRGAFTGAQAARRGLFESAAGGSIFLDELGDTAPGTQVRLLRVLQEGEIRPVGGDAARRVDVRVIAATNVDLQRAVAAGRFREDLYYRVASFRIDLPPLRERREDLPALAAHLLQRINLRLGSQLEGLAPATIAMLEAYRWPGNVRELHNVLEHAAVLARSGRVLPEHLPANLSLPPLARRVSEELFAPPPGPAEDAGGTLAEARARFERGYLQALLQRSGGNLSAAARAAGLDRSNLRRLLRRYDLVAEAFKDDGPVTSR